ncbi:MAG: hypothetical protein J3R72DRAFT_457930 [Linnemannia gamsii]|nr:MAG: hypothetical protein J3R72DRAFT_457930 [Linnemannia gamsii]
MRATLLIWYLIAVFCLAASVSGKCGPDNSLDGLVPDKPFGLNFGECCAKHDTCYETCGGRAFCDVKFWRCLLGLCSGKFKWYNPKRYGCYLVATTYYHGVFSLGWTRYPLSCYT